MNRISFHDTHIYPGFSVTIFFKIVPDEATVQAIAKFSDGSSATVEVEQVNQGEIFVRMTLIKLRAVPAFLKRIGVSVMIMLRIFGKWSRKCRK